MDGWISILVDIMIFDWFRQNATFFEYVFFTMGAQGVGKIRLDKEFAFPGGKNRRKKSENFFKKGIDFMGD